MLLDELIAVIEVLKRRIADHGPTLGVNETRTRMALIDPLLQVLGWDTTDPSIVIPEYDVSGRKADYALLDQKRRPSATIEAKRLGESLDSHLGQMINNSNLVGVEYAGITDGDQWQLYEVFRSGTLDERQLLNVRISKSPSYLIALKLLLLWRPNLTSDQVELASKPIAVPPTIVGPVPPVSDSIDWAPLSKFVVHKTTHLPEFIRFPDGSEHPLPAWNSLVLLTVEWLWSMGLLTTGNLSDFSSKARHLVYTEAIHPSGKQFFNPKPIAGTSVVVEANLSKFNSLKRTKDLLSGCGQDLSRVHLGVRRT